jgi:hypothetical protein
MSEVVRPNAPRMARRGRSDELVSINVRDSL